MNCEPICAVHQILVDKLLKLDEHTSIDLQSEFHKLTFDIIGIFTLGKDFNTQKTDNLEYYEVGLGK